jgi:hypothetical protein
MTETPSNKIEFSEPEIIGTVTWQTDLIGELRERTGRGEPIFFYEIDKLFDEMYSPQGRRFYGPPAFIVSSVPLTDQEQIQLVAQDEDLVKDIMRSVKNHGSEEDVQSARKKFIDAGVELRAER